MAAVVKCDICGGIYEEQDVNFKSIIRCNINNHIDLDICEKCMNKIKVFCSDINTNYKNFLDNILVNDGEKA